MPTGKVEFWVPGFLLSVASRLAPVLLTDFVLTYRCGAAPDSHRVPIFTPGPKDLEHRRNRNL